MRRFGFVALFLLPLVAHAQLALPGFQGALRITMTPRNPGPYATASLSLESALIDLDTSLVAWTVNGKPAGDARAIAIQTGRLGTSQVVSAEVTTAGGSIVSAETIVTPTEVDLLYDSNSYVPPLYRGRALPSAGTTVRLQAIPHFVKDNGTEVATKDIVFTWKRNGRVLGSVSGRGHSSADVDAPYLYGTDVISVEAASVDDTYFGSASVTVPAVDPVIRLYEDHPLFGLRFDRALGTSTSLADREMTFAAMPYYASVAGPTDPSLEYAWTVDGKRVDTAGATKHELTLGAADGGSATLALSLTHATNIFFGADAVWRISFGSQLGSDNPFVAR